MSADRRDSEMIFGGESKNDKDMLTKRYDLRTSDDVQKAIRRMWNVFEKNSDGRIGRKAYTQGLARFAVAAVEVRV